MKDDQLKFLQANDIVRMSAMPNVVQSVKNPNATAPSNVFTFTISGVAAATGKFIVAVIEGTTLSYSTTLSQTATTAATAIAAAWETSLNTAFGTGSYTASANSGVITLTRNDGKAMMLSYYYSTDNTQKITLTSGWWRDNQVLFEAQTAGTGDGKRAEDGYAVQFDLPNSNRSVKLMVNAFLVNESGAAKSARWRVSWFIPTIGWRTDTTAGLMTISSAGTAGTEITFGTAMFEATGATRVAVVLQDNSASGSLTGCFLMANAIVVN
jgi:hypothetical protein